MSLPVQSACGVRWRCTAAAPAVALVLYCAGASKEVRVEIVQVVAFRMVCAHTTHTRVHTEAPFVAVTKRRP